MNAADTLSPAISNSEALISFAGELLKVVEQKRQSCTGCCFAINTESGVVCGRPRWLACADTHIYRFADSIINTN